MARPRSGNVGGLLVAGSLVVAAAWVSGALAGPVTVIGPALASRVANRITPPAPTIGGCAVFPVSNAWNQDVSALPLRANSTQIISAIQASGSDNLHPDFGEDPTYGIAYSVVPIDQPLVPVVYGDYADESDPGPFPIPLLAPVEGGVNADGDRHVVVVQQGSCQLVELYHARRAGTGWSADSGAHWNLTTGDLRPIGWTSADAAGLPILPGLVRYDEVAAGVIRHAIRVTFGSTQRGFVLPATHFASSDSNQNLPAMGMRLRLKAGYDISAFTGQARVIAVALQHFGLIVADNGSNWFFQGGTDPRWNDDDLSQLQAVPGTAFEVVDTGPVRTS